MTKKEGAKKRIIIILTAALLALSVLLLFAVPYYNYTKEICVIKPVDRMLLEDGVSRDNILVEIEYSIIANGEEVENYLYVFENGDVYSGYNIDYRYAHVHNSQEQWEREIYFLCMDDKYWDYLYEQCYWGRLSPRDLDGIINELAQVHVVPYRETIDDWPVPDTSMGTQMGIQVGTQIVAQMESQTEQTYDQENNDFYGGHRYRGRMECEGTEGMEWISRGDAEHVSMYRKDEHAQNAIDIVKSTWAYRQWTNQIFGEGWEERIDLKDEYEYKGM